MLKKIGALAAVLLFLGIFVAMPAFAGVPKVIICENYGATW